VTSGAGWLRVVTHAPAHSRMLPHRGPAPAPHLGVLLQAAEGKPRKGRLARRHAGRRHRHHPNQRALGRLLRQVIHREVHELRRGAGNSRWKVRTSDPKPSVQNSGQAHSQWTAKVAARVRGASCNGQPCGPKRAHSRLCAFGPRGAVACAPPCPLPPHLPGSDADDTARLHPRIHRRARGAPGRVGAVDGEALAGPHCGGPGLGGAMVQMPSRSLVHLCDGPLSHSNPSNPSLPGLVMGGAAAGTAHAAAAACLASRRARRAAPHGL
jgi:hypothetical protein